MNWYRVTFARYGQPLKSVEVAAHDASDAMVCAGITSGAMRADEYEEDEIEIASLECIADPERAKRIRRLRRNALKGYAALSAQLAKPGATKEDV